MANQGTPQLRTHGPRGERLDVVEFHPAWHALMRRSMSVGLHSSVWDPQADADAKDQAHKVRAARFYLTAQLESGHLCPLTMTSASVAALSASPAVQKDWAPKILSRKYDSSNKPAMQKSAVTIGMGMTEKQGGTDVRANKTYGRKGQRRHLPAVRPQMVHVGADERRLRHAGADERGHRLLPRSAPAGRRFGQRPAVPAAEGQGRQPLQRLVRSRVHRYVRLPARHVRMPASARSSTW